MTEGRADGHGSGRFESHAAWQEALVTGVWPTGLHEHLESCTRCSSLARLLAEVDRLATQLDAPPIPLDLAAKIRVRIARTTQPPNGTATRASKQRYASHAVGSNPSVEFGNTLRMLRVWAGLTLAELADRTGLSGEVLLAVESGRGQAPRTDTIGLLAEALKLTTAERRILYETAVRPVQPSDLQRALRLLGPLEAQIMRDVWLGNLKAPFVVRDVQARMPTLAYATVMNTLVRLADKGLLYAERVPGQQAVSYQAAGTPADFVVRPDQRRLEELAPASSAAARPLPERALSIRERVLGPNHPDTAQSLHNLALLLRDQGDRTAARPLFERAFAIRERVLGPDHPDTAASRRALEELAAEGDGAGAEG